VKVCIITCYKQPDYIRAKTLRAALESNDGVELFVVKNSRVGALRYPEVFIKILMTRVKYRPDVYILTFRGYEMLIPVRLATLGKTFIFDEFINLVEWVVYEHKKLKQHGLGEKLLKSVYRFWLNTADLILTDTVSHADLSSKMMRIPRAKYVPLIVSTDENLFNANKTPQTRQSADILRVFYYGNMLPLHGVEIVLDAIKLLDNEKVELTLIGGDEKMLAAVDRAREAGVNVTYKAWVDFKELPGYMQRADICLAGPFGGTFQSQYVLTGKSYQFLQMKRPIIVGENKESNIFTDKKDALIVKQASAKNLARAINWAYENRTKLPAIGQAGFLLYQRKLSNKVLARRVKELLARL
jgi:glycosyltransferase involved in cell wall biosynthesis